MLLSIFRSFILLTTLTLSSIGFAQPGKDQPDVASLINERAFIFKAQFVSPRSGFNRILTSDYDVNVKKNTVVTYLPFFGRAYAVRYGSSNGALDMTSKEFQYVVEKGKNGWQVTILPKDSQDIRSLYFTIFDNGTATLQVISNDRETISFQGFITRN